MSHLPDANGLIGNVVEVTLIHNSVTDLQCLRFGCQSRHSFETTWIPIVDQLAATVLSLNQNIHIECQSVRVMVDNDRMYQDILIQSP